MQDLKYVSVRRGESVPIEIVAATPKGSLRVVPLGLKESLRMVRDLAGLVAMELADWEGR